ncbi:MAG: SGNH/GDSL hydrolase family protein, partial [Candidatus Marinimicrobia bacterium]|nr:SGNH/GDSL hydrolase family protein [Candidatus Neomarinimicrobiota bacterium]
MKKNIIISIGYLLVFFIGMISGILLRQSQSTWTSIQKCLVHNDSKVEDNGWDEDFKLVKIKSSIDNNIQKAYFFKSDANQKRPLIVSLHTWSGDYKQRDELAELCKLKNLNYIHPNFRGPNWTKKACCSKFALSDIEDAISFAVENSNVDTSKIFVIGVSGGGYATLSSFMRLEHDIEKFSAW